MSELSSSPARRLDADKLASRLRNGHSILFEARHAPQGLEGLVLMIDPLVRPVRAGDVVLLLEPTEIGRAHVQVVRVHRVRAHQLWAVGSAEPVLVEHALGIARTPRLSVWQRFRAWATR